MIVYILVSVMVNNSVGKSEIFLDTIPFKEKEKCEKVVAKLKPEFSKKYNKVEMTCQEKEVK